MERIFRKLKPSLAHPDTNLLESLIHRIRGSHISKIIIAQTKKGRREMCTLSRIYIFKFSLLFLQYLDYMSRKTRTVLPKRILFVLDSNSRRTIALYPDILWLKSIVFLFSVNIKCIDTQIYIMSLHIDDVFVPKLARKICRIYSELTAFCTISL